MRRIFNVFCIKREERWLMLFIFLFLCFLHGLVIARYCGIFTPIRSSYWNLFVGGFHVSGFDPITYSVVSDWVPGYNVYRHPLLGLFMYVPYLINQALMHLTGYNCAIFVVAAMQLFFGFYAMLFFYRIVRDITSDRGMATILALLFLSFAYVMITAIMPDHFIISMMLLLLALHISQRRIMKGGSFKGWQTVLYFLLTAGISLNNGLKIFLASLFVNGKRFFTLKSIVLTVILPSLFIWGVCRLEYKEVVAPWETAKHKAKGKLIKERKKRAEEARIAEFRQDSLLLAQGDTATVMAKRAAKENDEHRKAEQKKQLGPHQGKPISNGEFMRWTDISSSRAEAVVENLLGESIQLHEDYLLGDVLRNRPMVVRYTNPLPYIIEGVIILLWLAGVWAGRRSRFLWLVMSFLGMDMLLHVGLGFGINEVYIMSAHWIYAIPLAIAYAGAAAGGRRRIAFLSLVGALTAYLFIHNVALILRYFL